MGTYYSAPTTPRIDGFFRSTLNGWRAAQVGAIAACVSHNSTSIEPGIVTMPTGSGKTAVELALPHIFAARRTLVLVPTSLLRAQVSEAFRSQEVLRHAPLIQGDDNPTVLSVVSESHGLAEFQDADVVVAIPHTLANYLSGPNPLSPDLFDLVLVDEAHHAPAATWERSISHFGAARAFLFTATPTRRDGKALPGKRIYSYSIRAAIADGMFNPIRATVLPASADKDRTIAREVAEVVESPRYLGAPVLARVQTIERAAALQSLYEEVGLTSAVYHSKVPVSTRATRISEWRRGTTQVLIGVDALGEGVDFPDLRILAYHDKHKSDAATMQQIGRLARQSSRFPVESLVIVQHGGDEYPALTGALLLLYQEDADWAELVPDLIDREIREHQAMHDFVADFTGQDSQIDLKTIRPLGVVELREQKSNSTYEPSFYLDARIPDSLAIGRELAGYRVVLSQRSQDRRSLYLCLSAQVKPTWSDDDALATVEHHLCVLTWHPDPSDGPRHRAVLAITSTDSRIRNQVLAIIDPDDNLTLADVGRLQEVMDTLPRKSVSNVGVRSTSGVESGVAQYVNYSGRGVDRGLGESTMGMKALGHAMVQLHGDGHSINAGIAVEKGKYWELRHMSLLEYWTWITTLVSKYWSPGDAMASRLLPALARGARLDTYPNVEVVHAEVDPELLREGWRVQATGTDLADLELRAVIEGGRLSIYSLDPANPPRILVGTFTVGAANPTNVEACEVWRGGGMAKQLIELFIDHPPTLWLLDGTTVRGSVIYARPRGSGLVNADFVSAWDWTDFDIQNENGTAKTRGGRSESIHAKVEQELLAVHTGSTSTWVFCNDGTSEIADHIVVQRRDDNTAHIELWHSKASKGAKPSLRHDHFQELCAQGIKNRRWIIDAGLWSELAARLQGSSSPVLRYVGGAPLSDFHALVGVETRDNVDNFSLTAPLTTGEVVLVQPGLSRRALADDLHLASPAKGQKLIDILSVARSVIGDVAKFRVIGNA